MNAVKIWVKANLFLLICGVVIVAALSGIYFLVNPWRDKLHDDMTTALGVADQANTLDGKPVVLLPGKPAVKGPVVKWMIDAKKHVLEQMKTQADEITRLASVVNERNRVQVTSVVDKDGKKQDQVIPLLAGQPQPGLLPVNEEAKGDPMAFKALYGGIFNRWFAELCFGANSPPAVPERISADIRLPMDKSAIKMGMPPTDAEVTAAWELHKSDIQARETGRNAAGAVIGRVDQSQVNAAAQQRFSLSYLVTRDGQYRMYGAPDMFQIRPLATSSSAPNEKAIFEALVDIWIQQDIVNAIKAVNGKSSRVFDSPIKRLERIQIGAGALTTTATASGQPLDPFALTPGTSAGLAGEIFVNMTGATGGGGMLTGTDFNHSLTGRLGSAQFDITHFQVVLHLDPAYLNAFINELYRQNNGYTVLNVRIDAIDPFAAASNGFIYGKTSVIRAEITGEAMFFREWTKKIVPPVIRAALNPAMEPIPGTPQAAAAAAQPAAQPQ